MPYYLNLIHVLTNFVLLFVTLLFVHIVIFAGKNFWQAFLYAKITIDILGQNYDANHITAAFKTDLALGWLTLLFYAAIYIPGYIALGLYAFSEERG